MTSPSVFSRPTRCSSIGRVRGGQSDAPTGKSRKHIGAFGKFLGKASILEGMENENVPTPKPRAPRVRKPAVVVEAPPAAEQGPTRVQRRPFLVGDMPVKTAAGIAVVAGLIGGGVGVAIAGLTGSTFRTVVQPQVVTINGSSDTSVATAVASKALPSVVTIEVSGPSAAGSGSGVIYSENGYIITNSHVATLGGAEQKATIRVTLSDGRLFPATVVGTDPILDIAVIKINATGLVPVVFGDADSITVGSEVIAIGAPLGLQNTVTDGVVSALNRSITISNKGNGFNFDLPGNEQSALAQDLSLPVIQTDASINPGNSGGALLNTRGELVGINVAIASSGSSSGSIGVGFALPATLVKRVATDLIEFGSAQHGRIGAMVSAVGTANGVIGAIIRDVDPGSPAEAAGMEKGDVVTMFNGVPIRDEIDITAQVRSLRPGDVATFTYVRGGVSREGSVTVGSLE
ncbi:MAG: PDZ domain-containing protein [Actinobacteria bacterium]|nr:PDZ domain-containing protein [Actinomycetota bacterium]